MRKKLVLDLMLIIFEKIIACECLSSGYGNQQTDLDFIILNSEYIFSAIVVAKVDTFYPAYYKIQVTRIWKGNLDSTTFLTSGTGGPDCGIILEIGKEYLIYGVMDHGYLRTDRCTRTIELDKTGDIDYLDFIFKHKDYDTINFTENEIQYLKLHLIHNSSDSLLSVKTSLILFSKKLIDKKHLIGQAEYSLLIEFRSF